MNDDDRRTAEEIRRQLDAITPPDPDGFYSVANVDPSADPVELYRQGLAMGSGSVWYVGTERVATAITGNGPRSKANAEFYASAPSIVRWLLQFVERIEEKLQDAKTDSDMVTRERDEMERIAEDTHAALAAANARAEAAEAVAGNMLNHLLPDTIRAIVLDLSAAERHAPDMGEFAITPQTLEFRDKCATFLGAEWPDSAWDEEWLTALDAERARRARSEQDEVQSRAT